jgi:hypothetical protein
MPSVPDTCPVTATVGVAPPPQPVKNTIADKINNDFFMSLSPKYYVFFNYHPFFYK